jgi:hypothetical protein
MFIYNMVVENFFPFPTQSKTNKFGYIYHKSMQQINVLNPSALVLSDPIQRQLLPRELGRDNIFYKSDFHGKTNQIYHHPELARASGNHRVDNNTRYYDV